MRDKKYCNVPISDDQLEVTGYTGNRRIKRRLRGKKTKNEARDTIQKMYLNLPRQERRRLDYYRYEVAIQVALNNLLVQNGRFPTVLEIEYETGISRTTIYNHLKNEHKGYEEEFQLKINKLRKHAIERLYILGLQNGNVKALTEFLRLTAADEPKDKDRSLIQINNIYIDQRTIQNLPEDTREELELMFLESAKVDKS